MAKREDALFQEWLAETSEKFTDPEKRKQFEAFATDPTAGKDIFKGHLREQEFHRRLSDVEKERLQIEAEKVNLSTKVDEINTWYQENLPVNQRLKDDKSQLAKQLEEAKRELETLGLSPSQGRSNVVSEDLEKRWKDAEQRANALEARVLAMDTNFPQILGSFLDVTHKAIKENLDVSPQDILQYSIKKRVDPQTAFNELTATERQQRADDKWAKALEKAKEEGRREALKSTVHSPDRLKPALPFFQTLKPLATDDKDARASAAVAIFMDEEAS